MTRPDVSFSMPALDVLSCAPWHDRLLDLARGHCDDPYTGGEGWLQRARGAFDALPSALREAIDASRRPGPRPAALLLRDLPLDARLPATPLDSRRVPKHAYFGELWMACIGSRLGEPFAYTQLHGGDLFHSIAPVMREALAPSGECSTSPLRMHTDGATLPMAPDHLLLWCNRGDASVATYLYPLAAALDEAAPELVAALQRPVFRHVPDYEFEVGNRRAVGPAVPLLWWADGDARVRFDPDFLANEASDSADIQAQAQAAEALFDRHRVAVTLRPGDLLVFDNRRVLHARGAYHPRYDGTDRWLQCMYVTQELRSRPDTHVEGRMVTFPAWDAKARVTTAAIAAHVQAVTGRVDAIGADMELSADLGIDSYALIDLALTLERAFGVALRDEAMLDARTVGDLVLALEDAHVGGPPP